MATVAFRLPLSDCLVSSRGLSPSFGRFHMRNDLRAERILSWAEFVRRGQM